MNSEESSAIPSLPPGRLWTVPALGVAVMCASIISARMGFFLVGALVSAAGIAATKLPLRWPKPTAYYAAFVVWCAITAGFAADREVAFGQVVEHAKLLVMFVLFANALRSDRQLRAILLVCLIAFMVYPARGATINYLTGNSNYFGRVVWNGPYSNPNYLALVSLFMVGICLALTMAKQQLTIVRLAMIGCVLLILVIMLLTQSRGSFLGLLGGMGLPLLLLARRRIKGLLIGVVAVAVMATVVPSKVWDRFSGVTKLTSTKTIAQADPEGSAGQRWEIQKVGWAIFVDHPIIGVGLGNYPAANEQYAPALGSRDTHNTYLNLAAETGLPGLILWLAYVMSVLGASRRARISGAHVTTVAAQWLGSGAIAMLVSGIFGSWAKFTILHMALAVVWVGANLALPSGRENTLTTGSARGSRRR